MTPLEESFSIAFQTFLSLSEETEELHAILNSTPHELQNEHGFYKIHVYQIWTTGEILVCTHFPKYGNDMKYPILLGDFSINQILNWKQRGKHKENIKQAFVNIAKDMLPDFDKILFQNNKIKLITK